MKPVQFKSQYGSVIPYTRHNPKCPLKGKPDPASCQCPKWIYFRQKGAASDEKSLKGQKALNTPSWAEAVTKASYILDGFNPEIAQARKATEKAAKGRTIVADAVQMWLDRTAHKCGRDNPEEYKKGGSYAQYRSTFKGFITYIDKWNFDKSGSERIVFIDQVDTRFCTKWYESWKLANSVMRQRWGVVRSFFNYLHQQGVIAVNPVIAIDRVAPGKLYHHVPFTDEQYTRILDEASWLVNERVKDREREVYCHRMHIFVELLRWTGMDIGDAIQFQPEMVDEIGVLRYLRTKTDRLAVIPLAAIAPHLLGLLKEIPLAPESVETMPFRYKGNDLASDVHNWSRRIRRAMNSAHVTEAHLVEKSGKPAVDRSGNPIMTGVDVKMFRHTFAVGCLERGLPKDDVARYLGHVNTDMIDKHYAPWVKALDEALIRRAEQVMAQPQGNKNMRVVASKGLRVAAVTH